MKRRIASPVTLREMQRRHLHRLELGAREDLWPQRPSLLPRRKPDCWTKEREEPLDEYLKEVNREAT